MTHTKSLKKSITLLLLSSVFSAVFTSQAAQAGEGLNLSYFKSLKVMKFSKNLKVRGVEVSDGVYMGQAKVAGKYGLGVVVKNKSFSWGINNRGLSISKSF